MKNVKNNVVAKLLKELRMEKQKAEGRLISCMEVSTDLNFSPRYVAACETGDCNPSAGRLRMLVEYYGITLQEFLERVETLV